MRAFKVCTAILFALTVVRLAHAQDEVKRSETEFYVQTSGGAAEVCGLDYTIMYVDRRNLAGIRGQLAWMERASPALCDFINNSGSLTLAAMRCASSGFETSLWGHRLGLASLMDGTVPPLLLVVFSSVSAVRMQPQTRNAATIAQKIPRYSRCIVVSSVALTPLQAI